MFGFRKKPLVSMPQMPGQKKKKPVRGFAVAATLSLIAGFTVYYVLYSVIKPIPVVVAVRDIPALSQVKADDVKVTTIGMAYRHPQAFNSAGEVVGAYSTGPIYAGEQVIRPMLIRNPGQMVEGYNSLRSDETLLTLKADRVSWPPVLRDGDYVAVVAVYADRVEDVARKVRVATQTVPTPVVGNIAGAAQGQAPTSKITLLLNREDAKRVILATVTAKQVYLLPEQAGYVVGG